MRLFIAIDIPNEIRKRICDAQQELPLENLKLILPENLHITLKFLGEITSEKFQKINGQLRSVKHQPFNIEIRGVGAFPRVIWAGCNAKELDELVEKINKMFSEFPKEKFTGHLTIARIKQKISPIEFFKKYKETNFGSFMVEKFCLMNSELTSSGPKYSIVEEYWLENRKVNKKHKTNRNSNSKKLKNKML